MGLTAAEVTDITTNWTKTRVMGNAAVLANGGLAWGSMSQFVGTGALT